MDKHPLTIALETLNIDILDDVFAEDVVFYTPVLTHSVSGSDLVKRVLLTGVAGFGPPEVTGEFINEDGRRFVTWDATMDGHPLQAAMLVSDGPDGKVTELRAYMRPLPVVRAFRDYMYPHFRDDFPADYWELEETLA
jgi:hypothetical protein